MPSYIVSASQQNATLTSQNVTVNMHNATALGHNATAAGGNGTASGLNATAHGHIVMPASPSAAAALPPQHLFQHGRKCGLDNITHSDRKAASAVKIHSGLAEGEVSIIVQV
jgi:hypothetical protein